MITIIYLLTAFYSLLIFILFLGVFLLKKPGESQNQKISIIVAARNEEQHLPELLHRLAIQNYPEDCFEIIISNDRSTDATLDILQEATSRIPNLKYVTVKEENPKMVGKKGALTLAIAAASNPILAFTDADCLPGENWLKEIDRHFQKKVDYLAGYSPLIISNPKLNRLKNLERASIFAVTAGSFGINWALTSTGRNLAYRRELYDQMGGFKEIGHIRSGDDDLMLQLMGRKIRKFNFMFAPDSFIPSFDKEDLQTQIQLESRRASKFKHYPASIKLIILDIALFYLATVVATIAAIFGNFPLTALGIILLAKVLPEFLLLLTFLHKIGKKELMKSFPLAELIYIPYFLFFGIKGTFGKYKWKN